MCRPIRGTDTYRGRAASARLRLISPARRRRAAAPAAVALSVAAAFMAAPLAAQTPGLIEIGAEGGRYGGGILARGTNDFFTAKAEVDEDSIGGFWLAAQVAPKWKVEVTYRRSATRMIGYSGGVWPQQPALAGLDVAMAEAMAERCFRTGRFAPYVGAGVGLTNLDINLPDRSRRNPTRGSLAVNGGARFYLTPWLGLRVDMRIRAAYLGERAAPYDHGWSDVNRWYRTSEGLAGIFVALGSW